MDNNSLAHTKWNCKYHIVFTPKYRRQVIYKQISADIGQIIRRLCAQKGVEIIEAETDVDNIISQKVLSKCGFIANGVIGEEGPRFVLTRG